MEDENFDNGYILGQGDMLMNIKGMIRRKLYLNGEYVYVINCEDIDKLE